MPKFDLRSHTLGLLERMIKEGREDLVTPELAQMSDEERTRRLALLTPSSPVLEGAGKTLRRFFAPTEAEAAADLARAEEGLRTPEEQTAAESARRGAQAMLEEAARPRLEPEIAAPTLAVMPVQRPVWEPQSTEDLINMTPDQARSALEGVRSGNPTAGQIAAVQYTLGQGNLSEADFADLSQTLTEAIRANPRLAQDERFSGLYQAALASAPEDAKKLLQSGLEHAQAQQRREQQAASALRGAGILPEEEAAASPAGSVESAAPGTEAPAAWSPSGYQEIASMTPEQAASVLQAIRSGNPTPGQLAAAQTMFRDPRNRLGDTESYQVAKAMMEALEANPQLAQDEKFMQAFTGMRDQMGGWLAGRVGMDDVLRNVRAAESAARQFGLEGASAPAAPAAPAATSAAPAEQAAPAPPPPPPPPSRRPAAPPASAPPTPPAPGIEEIQQAGKAEMELRLGRSSPGITPAAAWPFAPAAGAGPHNLTAGPGVTVAYQAPASAPVPDVGSPGLTTGPGETVASAAPVTDYRPGREDYYGGGKGPSFRTLPNELMVRQASLGVLGPFVRMLTGSDEGITKEAAEIAISAFRQMARDLGEWVDSEDGEIEMAKMAALVIHAGVSENPMDKIAIDIASKVGRLMAATVVSRMSDAAYDASSKESPEGTPSIPVSRDVLLPSRGAP